MLLEAIDFLAREIIADKAIEGLARRADRLKPGAGLVVSRLYIGASAGIAVGRYAGKQTAENYRRGIPPVFFPYTPEMRAYDRSALRTTRII